MTSVFVTTRSREGGFEYFERLIRAWDSGFRPPTVICDVSQRSPEEQLAEEMILRGLVPDVRVFRRPEGTLPGNKLAYWACIQEAARVGGDALILEDDVEPCRNGIRRMSLFEIPDDLGYVTFFAPSVFLGTQQFPGLWRTPTPIHGTQAVKYSEAAILDLDQWRSDPEFSAYSASDMAIANASIRLQLKHAAHCPELVQHTGEVSLCEPGSQLSGKNRLARTYPGRNFDALSLYAVNKAFL